MRTLKTICVSLCLAGLLSSIGCCYHAQHFGKRRDIGFCEIGCATCCDRDEDCHGDCRSESRGNCCSNTITMPVNPVNPANCVR